jgi:pyruvate dehydrogenase phosphatase
MRRGKEADMDSMRREHPGEENTVIMRGRVHGGLQPTRAFGDASYKWTQSEAAV